MVIEVLSEELISQIAAGEVIENPAAVVKELVENAIDSGADEIEIDLMDSGVSSIRIVDNGCGISKEDLLKAPLRHATSKIRSFNDLYSISTMGFRGEALASIFSIAKTRIVSRVAGADVAYEVNSDDLSKVFESSCSKATTIVVEDLFFKTPARRKYLKSNAMELKAVLDVVSRFEVFYFGVKFVLRNNGKVLVNKPIFKSRYDNLVYVLGKDLKNNLLEFDCSMNGLRVFGFVGKPSSVSYSFRKNQFFFVNGRFVRSKLLRDAVYEGMRNTLMVGRHPFFVICVDIDPEIVDVNIHPTKIEIKFENELEVFEFMRSSVLKQFEEQENFKDFSFSERDLELSEVAPVREYDSGLSDVVKESSKGVSKNYEPDVQKEFKVSEKEVVYERVESSSGDDVDTGVESEVLVSVKEVELEKGILFDDLAEFKVLGQLNKTYILIETPKEFLMIDQHAAEEKYFFEKFKAELIDSERKPAVQMLLKAEVVYLTNSEMLVFEEEVEVLRGVGFDVEKFGENEVIVRGVPVSIRKIVLNARDLKDMLYGIVVTGKVRRVEEEKFAKVASMACRISVMGGTELTMREMRNIVERLRFLKQPFNCPHGRPSILKYSFRDLEKKFRRIV